MSGFWNKRRLLAGALALITAGGTSFLWSQSAGPSVAPPIAPPATAPMDPNAPIAMVNGLPINNAVFYELLIQADGWRIFQQVLDLALAPARLRVGGSGNVGAAPILKPVKKRSSNATSITSRSRGRRSRTTIRPRSSRSNSAARAFPMPSSTCASTATPASAL